MQLENINYWRWESTNRYYVVRLQQNLFGEWTLYKSWGGLFNSLGGVNNEVFSSLDEALKEVKNIDNHRIKRHYFLVEPTPSNNKKLLLLRLIDSLNQRFGRGKVKFGTN